MTEILVLIVSAFVLIAAAAVVGPRLGVAAPLVLVLLGVVASFLPMTGTTEIDPEWILEGVLPPLLYASAVSLPAMNFRREFVGISGLSVLLVIGSALALGAFFALVIPGLGFVWGVALGAIISPTDAVATSIIKQTKVSKRVVTILDGESLLNDATALVILSTASVAAMASTFSFWGATGTFARSVVVAVVIGGIVGRLNLLVRGRIADPAANTVISFAVPFLASVPASLLDSSGLVAAVVAGLITGIRAPRELSPQSRLSDSWNWRTIEMILEGSVFLMMGVQIKAIVENVERDHSGVGVAVLIAMGAVALTILVRAAYVAPLLALLHRMSRHGENMQSRLQGMQEKMKTPEGKQESFDEMAARGRRTATERDLDRFATRVTRVLADIDYLRREPLGWREGTAVVWAGMRGAVTVAAAQTLPEDTPHRSELVLIAFAVALISLMVQGGTIGPLLGAMSAGIDQTAIDEQTQADRTRLMELLRTSAESVPESPHPEGGPSPAAFEHAKRHRLAVLDAQRAALLDERDNGTFDADVLEYALTNLDASQLALEMRGGPDG